MGPDVLLRAALIMITLALIISLVRVIQGATLPDRVVAVDLIGISSVCLMVLEAAVSKESAFLDAAVVIALLGFLGTVAYARYAERKGRE
jgi:multicomponent Na+:H+ antiporter subunit F